MHHSQYGPASQQRDVRRGVCSPENVHHSESAPVVLWYQSKSERLSSDSTGTLATEERQIMADGRVVPACNELQSLRCA